MKKKTFVFTAIVALTLSGYLSYSQYQLPTLEADAVASYGKQYWKDGLTKICCDKSDINKPCSASTSNC